MRPPDHAEPYHLPPERIHGMERPAEGDLEGALVLLSQALALVPLRLTGVQAAIRIAQDGLRAAQMQPELFESEGER
jgi:hypothetical protein